MHLFEHNKVIDLFNSLQLMKIQFLSGEGLQTMISNIANDRFGEISKIFRKIIDLTNKGQSLETAIDNVQRDSKNRYLKFLLNSFKMSANQSIDLSVVINEVEKQIMDEHKDDIDKYIMHTNRFSLVNLYITFLPFFYVIIEIINWVMTDFMESEPIIDNNFRIIFFGGTLVLIFIFTLLLRYNEP